MMIGFPLGIYGVWKEYVFFKAGGSYFGTPEYGLVFLFIVLPISFIFISTILKAIAHRLEPGSINIDKDK